MHHTSAITYPGKDVDACLCRCQSHVPSLGLYLDLSFLRHSFNHSFSRLISYPVYDNDTTGPCRYAVMCVMRCAPKSFSQHPSLLHITKYKHVLYRGIGPASKKRRQVTDGQDWIQSRMGSVGLDPVAPWLASPVGIGGSAFSSSIISALEVPLHKKLNALESNEVEVKPQVGCVLGRG